MNVVVLNLKLMGFDIGPRDAVQAGILDINNAPAAQADEVVMLVEFGVEARRGTRVAGPGHETDRNERTQDAVHGHSGHLRQLRADRTVKLLRGGMIAAILNRFKDRSPLSGDRQAAFAVSRDEAVHSLLFF